MHDLDGQISRWNVIVAANLIQPLASVLGRLDDRRTFPRTIRKPSKTNIDLAPKGLMSGAVFPKHGYDQRLAERPLGLLTIRSVSG